MKKRKTAGTLWKLLIALYLIIPLMVTLIYSFAGRWITIMPENFTLSFYIDKFTDAKFFFGILRGIIISIIPVLITNVIILFVLFAVIVYFPKTEKYVQICCIIPTTINGIILATSVLSTYAGSNTIFSNRIVMLLFIYCIFCLPLTYQGIRNSLYAVNTKCLLEAAGMLGANECYAFIKIVVPAILPGLLNTALISFSGLFGDFAIIKMIASSQYETVQTYLYQNRNTDTQAFSAGVVIVLVITMAINLIVQKTSARHSVNGKEMKKG